MIISRFVKEQTTMTKSNDWPIKKIIGKNANESPSIEPRKEILNKVFDMKHAYVSNPLFFSVNFLLIIGPNRNHRSL